MSCDLVDPYSFPRTILAGLGEGDAPELTPELAAEHDLVKLAHPFTIPDHLLADEDECRVWLQEHLDAWAEEVAHRLAREPAGGMTVQVLERPAERDVVALVRAWFRPLPMPQLWPGDQA